MLNHPNCKYTSSFDPNLHDLLTYSAFRISREFDLHCIIKEDLGMFLLHLSQEPLEGKDHLGHTLVRNDRDSEGLSLFLESYLSINVFAEIN